MRATHAALFSIAILVVFSLLLAGCVTMTADGVQLQPLAGQGGGNPAAALGIDPAAYIILDLERSGGIVGLAERARLYLDGHVLLERRGQEPVTFQLSQAEQAQLSAALDAADFYRNAAETESPAAVSPDAFQYRIQRRGVLLQGEVVTQDGSAPAWLDPLLPLLTNLLLTPDPARVQSLPPATAALTPTVALTQTVAAPVAAEAPAIVLLEFVRSQPDGEVRVLVNLDRTYSIAAGGAIEEGALTREEMAALTRLLEVADLRSRAGDYTPAEPCADCARYIVTYRNLLGGATVRGEEGALPDWFQVLADTLDDAFVTASLATPTPPAATPTAAAPADGSAYSLDAFLADLTAAGAQAALAAGRVNKPYLSAPGVLVRVNGQPVQVFQYTDAAALAADVAGLAPTAGSIDGVPLVWPAAPHFWRKGGLLALAVSNDQALVELVSSVMGPQFAGRP
jgi:hypothetical protein